MQSCSGINRELFPSAKFFFPSGQRRLLSRSVHPGRKRRGSFVIRRQSGLGSDGSRGTTAVHWRSFEIPPHGAQFLTSSSTAAAAVTFLKGKYANYRSVTKETKEYSAALHSTSKHLFFTCFGSCLSVC